MSSHGNFKTGELTNEEAICRSDLLAFLGPLADLGNGLLEPLGFVGPFPGLVFGVLLTFDCPQIPMLIGISSRCHVFETLVMPTLVVVDPPSFDLRPGFVNSLEPVNIQALVPE